MEPLEPAGYEFDLEITGPVELVDPFGPGGPFAGSQDRVEAHQN